MSAAHQQSSHGAFILFARSGHGFGRKMCKPKVTYSCWNNDDFLSCLQCKPCLDTPRAVDSRVVSTNQPACGKIKQGDHYIGEIVLGHLAKMGQQICGSSG